MDNALTRANALLAARKHDLLARGYPPQVAEAAIKRARRTAESIVLPISPEIRGQAYLDILRSELAQAESWAGKEMQVKAG